MASPVKRIRPAYILIAFFTLVLVLGLVWGGFGKVMANAVVICLDCIGLI